MNWQNLMQLLGEYHLVKVLTAISIVFLAFILRKIFVRYLLRAVLKFTSRTNTEIDTVLVKSAEGPLRALIIILGIFAALHYLPLSATANLMIASIFRIIAIIIASWAVYNFICNFSAIFYEVENRFDIKIDNILVPFLSKVARVILILLSFVIILSEFGYDVNGFIAGIGLGGLTIALAAQSMAANIFGGIVIIVDKPFTIGDWIETPTVEGTVEDISFRSTKLRTFADAVSVVPNATLANEAITNWSRMGRRRVSFNLGVEYGTSRVKLEKCVKRIKTMLEEHDGVHEKTIFVRFDAFNDSSLDIFIYFFTNTTVWGEFLAVKEEVNYLIMEILEEEGVAAAFPSTSLYLKTPLKMESKRGSSSV